MDKAGTKNNVLFLVGAVIVTVSALLSAFIEGLAYVTQWINTFGPVAVKATYYPLVLSIHPATGSFAVCTFGGLLGLAYSVGAKRTLVAFTSIFLQVSGCFCPSTSYA